MVYRNAKVKDDDSDEDKLKRLLLQVKDVDVVYQ